ncbi:hypothetical protein CR513_15310, partial [Mucuna pruriens]
RPSGRRFVESDNIQENHYMSIGKDLISCESHVHTTKLANNYCYRLLMMDHNMIDVASGRALMDKTPATTRYLISNMAGNTQHFRVQGGAGTSRAVREVGELADRAHVPCETTCCRTTSTSRPTALGSGHQFGRQPYLNWQFDNQQFRRQLYQPNPNQGQYVAPRFGPTGGMLVPNQANYQQQGPRYQAPTFRQQPQQLLPPQQNSSLIEDLVKQMLECNLQFQKNITATIHEFKNVGGITGRHGEPNAVGRFRNNPLTDNFESERGRSRHGATTKR